MKSSGEPRLFKFPFRAMGSPCEIQLYARDDSAARRIAHLAIADAERLEARYSRYRDDSLLSAINRVAAAGGIIDVDDETASLLNYADTCHQQSDGLFDITSGLLRQAWNFKSGILPEDEQIRQLLDRIGWNKVRWSPPTIGFEPGMELDLGGIVKEYAADHLATLCRNAGARHGLVNLGGDIRVHRSAPGRRSLAHRHTTPAQAGHRTHRDHRPAPGRRREQRRLRALHHR
jgi:thiamine biosynthesis lipoprotein